MEKAESTTAVLSIHENKSVKVIKALKGQDMLDWENGQLPPEVLMS